jgi:acetyl esterase/lipase
MNTPWSDLAMIGGSYYTNEGVDPMLPSYAMLGPAAELYAGHVGLDHPLVSPVYGDYTKGFPPSFLPSGTRDMLLSCTVRLHRALRSAGIEAELHVFDAMWHGFGLLVPVEGGELDREMIAFLERHLGNK